MESVRLNPTSASPTPSFSLDSLNDGKGSLVNPQSVHFVNLTERHICVKCKEVLQNPVQTPCGHLICFHCGDELKKDGTPIRCPADEADCEDIDKDTVLYPDRCAAREVKRLLVYCVFQQYGCSVSIPWYKLSEHVKNCWYRPTKCSNHGCSETFATKDINKHEREECIFRAVACPLCGEMLNFRDKEAHDKYHCPLTEEPCPYMCGEQCILRNYMASHKRTCPNRPVSCKYAPILGCSYQGSDQEVQLHENTSVEDHFELATLTLAKLQTENLRLENLVSEKLQVEDSQKGALQELKCKVEARDMQIADNTTQLHAAKEMMDSMKNEHHRQMLNMKAQVDTFQEQLRKSESTISSLTDRLQTLEFRRDGSDTSTDVSSRLVVVERTLSSHASAFNDYNIRMQCLETTSYDGRMTWKISDYSRRKRDAVSRRTLSLYSQPFFSHRNGYKMCLRIYLNGDGLGKDTHASLFFVIMRGEYDNLLRWPFQQRVTLKLHNQDEGRDIVDSFIPDVTSSSFQKPRSEMNVASGCPMFVEQRILESSKFLKDDSIYITADVETNNCFV